MVAAAAAKSLQSCSTLCDHIDGSPPGSPVPWDSPGRNTEVGCHFLLQCIKVKVKSLSRVRLLATPRTAAHQAPLSVGFSRQEYWSGLPLPSPTRVSVMCKQTNKQKKEYKYKKEILVQSGLNISPSVLVLCGLRLM